MPRIRRDEGGLGDWSSTGTFLRKPSTGWLHEDRELCDQSSINYRIWYLGCIEVCQSMRTLQYNTRTQVTKEAIVRMAEVAGKLQHKRKKVPKQLNRLLGAVDTRWAGEVNLAVSAECLKLSNAASDREIMNHSLPSISFASGGDGSTMDFIGYVAKDPVHERACHVFECVECSQYVLTTIGQAFELRYKMYLNSPQPEPMQIRNSVSTGDAWSTDHTRGPETGVAAAALPSIPGEPHSPYSPSPGAGIYSDLPEFPNDTPLSPSASPSISLPPLSAVSGGRTRVYSQLPGFPTLHEDEASLSNGVPRPRLDNPYDTIHSERPQFTDTGVYSEPGEVTSSDEAYSTHMMTIRQSSAATPVNSELIDLAPPPPQPNHVYTNSSVQNGVTQTKSSPAPLPKPRPLPRPRTVKHVPSAEPMYDNPVDPPPVVRGRGRPTSHRNDYDDPDALQRPTRAGTYDDVQDIIAATTAKKFALPAAPRGPPGRLTREAEKREGPGPTYDDPNTIIINKTTNGTTGGVVSTVGGVASHYDEPTEPHKSRVNTPKFDDTIYAIRRDVGLEEGEEEEASGNTSPRRSGPPDPLSSQPYYHGVISRVEAEALLENEGEFLVRESSKIACQFVLTGMSHEGPQHLLLMDKTGRVRSRDHEFDSVPHLVEYFTSRDLPLVIGKSQVFLRRAIFNAFPGNRAT